MKKNLALLLIATGILGGCEQFNQEASVQSSQSAETSSSSVSLTPEEEQKLAEEAEHQAMLDALPDASTEDWNLELVNNWTKIDESIERPLSALPNSNGLLVDQRIIEEYTAMTDAGKEAGHEIIAVSTFRSVELQTTNYNNSIQKYVDEGHSKEEAVKLTEDYIAIPGGSEHHTGLAIDVMDTEWLNSGKGLIAEFDTQASQQWLVEHAADYGFVLRFPKGKEAETGIEYESWHFRYVGKENAAYMKNYNLSLEEYIALLNEAGK
ncbi:M15 family metallopeptidase [Carnobacterium viridans]|uniref:D-Ala-D-Ala carboxypeptidase. Metallo peptidase. MEROPS family M15B n=1 Tax=Carnobacterium viridans TaxID=174587 RepID=A0A1H0YLH7_9LACT|nr:M15 family metallopeptidase [Carnobacterium viridans]UDE95067.1 M15 family metallopeptidase [Carnobacterium viridans]SDQ15998.1 D-Ala-D-Ala carboxypeptidase. Metallo peptidase. MEROPS family M15B [Carnobacterium viridans]